MESDLGGTVAVTGTKEAALGPAVVATGTVVSSQAVAETELVKREVKLTGRTLTDKSFAILFALSVGFWAILAIVIAFDAHPHYSTNSKGYITGVSDYYLDDMKTCCDNYYDTYSTTPYNCAIMYYSDQWTPYRRLSEEALLEMGRRLGSGDDKNTPKKILEGFGNEPIIPITMIFLVLFVCIGFVWCMEKCSYQILLGTFFLEFCACLFVAINPLCDGENCEPIYIFFLPCIFIVVWVALMRKKIEDAAKIISLAAEALLDMPSLMCAVYSWLLVSGVLVVIYILVLVASGQVVEVTDSACEFEQKGYIANLMFLVHIIWGWMWFYSTTVMIFFVAGCVGTYHFGGKAAAVASLPLTMIKIAVTTSAGTLAKLAIVFEVVDYIRRKSRVSCKTLCCCANGVPGFLDPTVWIACLIRCCCLEFLKMMTKFCLIFHCFTGDAFYSSAKNAVKLLKKSGLFGLVLETAAINTFQVIKFFLSIAVGVACWSWMDSMYGFNVFADSSMEVVKYVFLVLFAVFMLVPMYAIILVILVIWIIEPLMGTTSLGWLIAWCCGLFIGAITSFFFEQTTKSLLYASNTMFVAIAIDKTYEQAGVPITGEKSKFALAMCEKVDDPTVQRLDEDGQIITVEASATAAPASAVAMHNNV